MNLLRMTELITIYFTNFWWDLFAGVQVHRFILLDQRRGLFWRLASVRLSGIIEDLPTQDAERINVGLLTVGQRDQRLRSLPSDGHFGVVGHRKGVAC